METAAESLADPLTSFEDAAACRKMGLKITLQQAAVRLWRISRNEF